MDMHGCRYWANFVVFPPDLLLLPEQLAAAGELLHMMARISTIVACRTQPQSVLIA